LPGQKRALVKVRGTQRPDFEEIPLLTERSGEGGNLYLRTSWRSLRLKRSRRWRDRGREAAFNFDLESEIIAPMFERLKSWAHRLKRDIYALYLAARDPRVPWYAKVLAGLVAAYALSPIDPIPDFIPVLGYLDDLIVIPLGIKAAILMIPDGVMSDLRRQAEERMLTRPRSVVGAVFVVLLWLAVAVFLVRWILKY